MRPNISKRFSFIASLIFTILSVNLSCAQNTWTGATNANWNTGTNWSLLHVPTALEAVNIPNGVTATINVNTAAVCSSLTFIGGNAANTLSISAGNSLTVSGTITINNGNAAGANKFLAVGAGSVSCGSVSISATGNNNRNSGISLSTGSVTVGGSISMGDARDQINFTGNGTLFIGNTMSGGTLSPGTGTVNYNAAGAQSIGAYPTYNNLTLSGSGNKFLQLAITTINGNFTLSGTASTTTVNNTLSIGGNVAIGDGTILNIANTNFSVTGTTTVGAGTSGQINFTSAVGTTAFGPVTISANGSWTNPANESMSIGGNLSVGNSATFSQGTGTITFAGTGASAVTSPALLTFGGGIIINTPVGLSDIVDFQSLISIPAGGLTLSQGVFKLSSASTITPFTADPAFGATAGLWCNGGTLVGSNNNVTFSGLVQVSAGTVNIGTSTENDLVANNGSAGTINISGGALNVAGRMTGLGPAWNYTMTGGTCTVGTVGANANTNAYIYFMPNGSQFSMSGGTLVIQSPVPTTTNGYYNHASGGSGFTGGSLQIGNASTPGASTIGIDSTIPIFNLTVGSNNATAQVFAQGITVSNNVTIPSGVLAANNFGISVGGNWTNNSTFVPGSATVTLNGSGAQTIGGTTANFYNLAMTGSGTNTLSIATSIAGNLSIGSGVVC
ncbi:MAG: hypothetical protein JSS73_02205, partial [Bacteroidetes bacterium]|nr:hypothetical protein [Bacteroidota bacterium]